MTFWRSKTLLLVLLLAWTTPAVALGGLALHLELEHGHSDDLPAEHPRQPGTADGETGHRAHPGHRDPHHSHQGHSHPAAVGALQCEPGDTHGVHFSDGSHHHHAFALPGHDHQLLPARGHVRLQGPVAQVALPTLAVWHPSLATAARMVALPVFPSSSPLLLTTVLLL